MGFSALHPRISIDPAICHGKPVVKGTRVLVEALLAAIAGGDDVARVADDYGVAIEDVRAAVSYASSLVGDERHYPIRKKAS